MKGFLHALSAFGGLALAATIVFFVFGQADEQGAAQEGSGGDDAAQVQASAQQGSEQCGTVAPGKAGSAAAVKQATGALPAIFNEQDVEVRITDAGQERWFARMQAASGLCLDEVRVRQQRFDITATYSDSVSRPDVESYVYGVIRQAFQDPLARDVVFVSLRHDGRQRTALVRHDTWMAFQQNHRRLGFPATVQGMRKFRQRVGYGPQEMRFVGW